MLGEKELSNTEVYSICQTPGGLVYIGTDRGMLVYTHGEFEHIPEAKGQLGNSVFNLKLDKTGTLYCGNLKGQIFKLIEDELILAFELEKEGIGLQLLFEFDDQNHLVIVSGTDCLKVGVDGSAEKIFSDPNGVFTLDKLVDDRLVIGLASIDSIGVIADGLAYKESTLIAADDSSYNPYFNHVLLLNNQLISFFADGSIGLLENGTISNQVKSIVNERYFQFTENTIWALDHAKGIRKISLDVNNLLSTEKVMYTNQFISSMTIGENGTLFLGTFGDGILVIPNESTNKHIIYDKSFEASGIAVDDQNNVFLSTRDGRVIHYNQTAQIIENIEGVSIDKIYYAKSVDFGVNELFSSLLYSGKGLDNGACDHGAVKDVYCVDSNNVFIATSIGIFKKGEIEEDAAWKVVTSENLMRLNKFHERCEAVAYHEEKSELYIASSLGLYVLNSSNEETEILFNGKPIICNDLLIRNDELWCATYDQGVLVFNGLKVVRQIGVNEGLNDQTVSKIEFDEDRLFILHNEGLQAIDVVSNEWVLGVAEGVVDESISDFSLSSDRLWILSDGQPVSLFLNELPSKKPELGIVIDSILVFDYRIDLLSSTEFKHKQNQLSFYVNFIGVEYESETTIKYRIRGFDDDWKTIGATEEVIDYEFLPPGEYVFEIKMTYREMEGDTVTFAFTILPPYWQTAWFYLVIGLGFIVLMLMLYFYQIKRMAKRNKEKLEKQRIETDLLETELKALRSQMNPHFIFNSLNSIQDLILQQDTDASYDYIVLFADLVRNTLNYSNKDFISIDKELDFLEVYLSLEKLRFEEDFNYEISYNGSRDVNVPSLLVQPFIENALVHGLLHKSGLKTLSIEFECSDTLTCTITDNGVGRERSKEIQKRRGNEHESFALEAINKRLSILQEQYREEVGYVIHDLYEDDQATGTKVVITMPYTDQF